MRPRHSAAHASRGRLLVVFGIALGVLVVEFLGGLAANSLALLADAGHLATDAAGVGLALLAIWIGSRPADGSRTFGLLRLEILAAVVNAVLLFGVSAFVLMEAWRRWMEPPEVTSGLMLAVAVFGLVANGVSLWLLRDARHASLNVGGAYLEVLGDFLGSIAVIGAAVVIAVTGFLAADALASAVIGLAILPRTWALLRDAVDVLLEATPRNVDLGEVRRHILEAPGVADVHDLHAWTITSGMNVVSAHVILVEEAEPPAVLDHLCRCLSGVFDIEHSTFQLETADRRRLEEVGHP